MIVNESSKEFLLTHSILGPFLAPKLINYFK